MKKFKESNRVSSALEASFDEYVRGSFSEYVLHCSVRARVLTITALESTGSWHDIATAAARKWTGVSTNDP